MVIVHVFCLDQFGDLSLSIGWKRHDGKWRSSHGLHVVYSPKERGLSISVDWLFLFAGTLISKAPLVGADCYIDADHPRWLHVHVRPHARALLKAIRVSSLPEPPSCAP